MVLGEPALCQCLGDSSVWQHKGIIAFLKTWTSIIFHWKKFPKLWNKLLFFLFYKDQNSRFLSVIRAFHSFDQGDVMAQWVLQHPSTYYTLCSLGDKAVRMDGRTDGALGLWGRCSLALLWQGTAHRLRHCKVWLPGPSAAGPEPRAWQHRDTWSLGDTVNAVQPLTLANWTTLGIIEWWAFLHSL